MLCKKPFRQGVVEYGCGQCMPCRISRRRLWACRLMLEAREHQAAFFVTLTYAPEFLPVGGTLVPRDLQLFLKRLRLALAPLRLRFYAVGEYGEVSERPHYHLCIFCPESGKFVDSVKASWKYGLVDIRVLSWDLSWYIAGYITKRMTNKLDRRTAGWLRGRHPEFARMSLKPGLGAKGMARVAEALNTKEGVRFVLENGDVPIALKMHGKTLPIGRYLARRLREECGYEAKAPEGALAKRAWELREELILVGGRELRESRRIQHNRNAEARNRLSTSKRVI